MASRSWNRTELIGNLTRDPELRYTPNGAAVATFSVATNRSYMSDGERKEDVDFHRVVAWNKLAELCSQLLKKGNRVFVSGRLQNRSWEGQDGTQKNTTEIVLEDMIILTARGTSGESVEEYSEDISRESRIKNQESREEKVEEKAEESEQVEKKEKDIKTEKTKEKDKVEEEDKLAPVKTENIDPEDIPF